MATENIKTKLEDLVNHSSELGETAFKLVSINAYRKTANVSASLLVKITLSLIAIIATLFCSVAFSFWLGNVLQSVAAGFLVTGGFYFFMLIVFLLFRKKLILPFFRNQIVKKIYE